GRRSSPCGGDDRGSDELAAVHVPGAVHAHEDHTGVLTHQGDSRGAVAVVDRLDHRAVDGVHHRRIDGALLGLTLEALGAERDLPALQRLVGARVRDQRAGGLTVGRRSGLEELVVGVPHRCEVVLGERLCGVVTVLLGGAVIVALRRIGIRVVVGLLGPLGVVRALGVLLGARVLGVLRGPRVLALGVGGAVLLLGLLALLGPCAGAAVGPVLTAAEDPAARG